MTDDATLAANLADSQRANALVLAQALISTIRDEDAAQIADLTAQRDAAETATETVQGKLEALQAKYDAYVAAHPDTQPTPTPDPTPTPTPTGIVVGAAWEGGTDVSPLEKRLGGVLRGHRTYWGKPGSAVDLTAMYAVVDADLQAGRRPFVTSKIPPWADVAAGKYDTWVRAIGVKLASIATKYGKPVYVDLHHEPEGDGTQADWRAMLAHTAPLMKSALVKVGANVQGYHSVPNTPAGTNPGAPMDWKIASVVPPGMDWLGIDPYELYGNKDNSKAFRNWDAYYAYVASQAKALGIPEWGVCEIGVTLAGFQQKSSWFGDNIATATKNGAAFWLYFDSNAGGSTSTWRMDNPTPDAREAAFGQVVKAHQ